MKRPAEHFDGWRIDIDTPWEAYNRIYFSYKRSEFEQENYLRRLYRSHFVVFSYSFIDSIVSNALLNDLNLPKSRIQKLKGLRSKVDVVDQHNTSVRVLDAYDEFWKDIEWIRNELVHPSRRDHLAAIELDKLNLGDRIRLLNIFAVRHFEAVNQEFPYWLTGWNLVNSMTTGRVSDGIIVSNNTQFKVFLQMLGRNDLRFPAQALETINRYLIGKAMYNQVAKFVEGAPFNTQPLPKDVGFSLMPLWSKVWWDRNEMEKMRAYRVNHRSAVRSQNANDE
ncbi:MAG: hypothetical protein K2P86_05325 [Xanthobacteraceae bacterium]|nr:hypothetical protein [Xanthobacteraceae bacterium]